MDRHPEPSIETTRRNDAALEEVRRLFARYRSHPIRPVERPEPRNVGESQPAAETGADHPHAAVRP